MGQGRSEPDSEHGVRHFGMTATDHTTFAARLRRLRLAAGLTQERLAERAGLSARAVSDLERDSTRTPRLETASLLAEALGLNTEDRARLLAAARPESTHTVTPVTVERPSLDVPRPLTPMIGRGHEVNDMVDLVVGKAYGARGGGSVSRLLTLTGPGGVGKTRLALEVVERVAERFGDGVLLVDLAPLRDPDQVVPTIAQTIGLDERDPTPLLNRTILYLRDKHLLLLLDNVEQVVEARKDIVALLEGSRHLVIVATSREPLRVRAEREYRVEPFAVTQEPGETNALAQSPAVQLFLDRAHAAGTELSCDPETLGVVAQVCRRLDGLPLAIELAAAWTRLFSPSDLLLRLEHRLPLLVAGPPDLPARQQTMRDTIAWSYALLEPQERRLFRWLCVFTGGFGLEDAEAVTSTVAERLMVLVDKNLVHAQSQSERRLAVLETIREYGLERLREDDEEEQARGRHAAYYLALAERTEPELGGPDQAVWLGRLDREHDNLRAALSWFIECRDAEGAHRLAGALRRFWSARGYIWEGRRWFQRVLSLERGDPIAPSARVAALAGAAMLAMDQGAYEEASPLCAEAVTLAQEDGDRHALLLALNTQGLLLRQRGRHDDAAKRYEEVLTVARAVGDRAAEATALGGLALMKGRFRRDPVREVELFEEGLAIYRGLGDVRSIAITLNNLAWSAMTAGEYERAETLREEALTLFRSLGDTGQVAETLWAMGNGAQREGKYEQAAALLEESLGMRRTRGDERSAAVTQARLAHVLANIGDLDRARELVTQALATIRRYDDPWGLAMVLTVSGHVELITGEVDRAEALLDESARLFLALDILLSLSWCFEGLAGVAVVRGEYERAARLVGARDGLLARLESPLPSAHPVAYGRMLQTTRTALGEEIFAKEWTIGAELPLDVVIAS